ncbi:hypothetical protein HOF65_08300 [bacterium]|nr:hypothetical protein [bacterium]MBT3853884.1 hypothetical protein [bacterium]MBT4633073.1 hypothetical protein [bacterium]MBT6778617.1 hypothetical protein [bacterium]
MDRFHICSISFEFGFSTIFKILSSLSILYIQYFSGFDTFCTNTQYQLKLTNFSISL